MRGLVTLATAFALPADFPQRDTVVLAAFAVVLATLVLQGLTLSPLIGRLGLDRRAEGRDEMAALRGKISQAGVEEIARIDSPEADLLRRKLTIEQKAPTEPEAAASLEVYRRLALGVVAAQRRALQTLYSSNKLNVDEYNLLLEEIDWRELSILPDDQRRIEEI